MGLLDFFREKRAPGVDSSDADIINGLLDRLIDEAIANKVVSYKLPPLAQLPSYTFIKSKSQEEQKKIVLQTFVKLGKVRKELEKIRDYTNRAFNARDVLKNLISIMIRGSIDFTDDDLLQMVNVVNDNLEKGNYFSGIPYTPLISKIEENIQKNGLNDKLISALRGLFIPHRDYAYNEHLKINERINYLLQGSPDIRPDSGDLFGKAIIAFLDTVQDATDKQHWQDLLKHCKEAEEKSAPSKKWIDEAGKLVELLGAKKFSETTTQWLKLGVGILQDIHRTQPTAVYLKDVNHSLLKGLIWCSGKVNDVGLQDALDEYGQWAYKKIPNRGAVSVKTGNACLYSFSILPFQDGISKLTKFRMKIKYPSIQKQIDKYINQVARANGYTRETIEDISVPSFGLDANGKLIQTFGNCTAEIEIKSVDEVNINWEKDGKKQSSVPAQVKTDFATELATLKKQVKEIQALLPVHRDRIEQFYLKNRSWKYVDWSANFIEHPLMALVAKNLIWHFTDGNQKTEGIFLDRKFVDADSKPIDWLTKDVTVQLWHPIGFEADYVLKWRNFLRTKEIVQPFKQAFREVYIVTDAELNTRSYSNRFAAHILRQHQFAALCKQRGWRYTLQGGWDSHNSPVLQIPEGDIAVEFYVDAAWNESMNDMGIYNYVTTDQVRFSRAQEPLNMDEVPAMVFTEVMRDVDLFVGVTSIGNDPSWQDSGNQQLNQYWRNYSFGDLSESAKMREEVLKNLVPRMKIADHCSFDGKYLIVNGKRRKYKIHLGSGNILMSPNDQYLCIVPGGRNAKDNKVFLPFEGDNLLSIILSKALLLADDDKITDPTILSQLNR
jgi:hypothetical protein